MNGFKTEQGKIWPVETEDDKKAVLDLLAQGNSADEISSQLNIRPSVIAIWVDEHRRKIQSLKKQEKHKKIIMECISSGHSSEACDCSKARRGLFGRN